MTWSWGLDGCAQRCKVTITVAIQSNWVVVFSIEFKQCFKTNELVPGWQRAVAQGYNYSYNKIELVINCQLNLKS